MQTPFSIIWDLVFSCNTWMWAVTPTVRTSLPPGLPPHVMHSRLRRRPLLISKNTKRKRYYNGRIDWHLFPEIHLGWSDDKLDRTMILICFKSKLRVFTLALIFYHHFILDRDVLEQDATLFCCCNSNEIKKSTVKTEGPAFDWSMRYWN